MPAGRVKLFLIARYCGTVAFGLVADFVGRIVTFDKTVVVVCLSMGRYFPTQ